MLKHIFSVYTELSLFLFHTSALAGREQEVLKAPISFGRIRHSVIDFHSV